jgi:hypothetical protein
LPTCDMSRAALNVSISDENRLGCPPSLRKGTMYLKGLQSRGQ